MVLVVSSVVTAGAAAAADVTDSCPLSPSPTLSTSTIWGATEFISLSAAGKPRLAKAPHQLCAKKVIPCRLGVASCVAAAMPIATTTKIAGVKPMSAAFTRRCLCCLTYLAIQGRGALRLCSSAAKRSLSPSASRDGKRTPIRSGVASTSASKRPSRLPVLSSCRAVSTNVGLRMVIRAMSPEMVTARADTESRLSSVTGGCQMVGHHEGADWVHGRMSHGSMSMGMRGARRISSRTRTRFRCCRLAICWMAPRSLLCLFRWGSPSVMLFVESGGITSSISPQNTPGPRSLPNDPCHHGDKERQSDGATCCCRQSGRSMDGECSTRPPSH